jgi:hypothetical protein
MDLEYVSVEDSEYAPEQKPPVVGKPPNSPRHPPRINRGAAENDRTAVAKAETARVLGTLLAKGVGAQDHVKQYLLLTCIDATVAPVRFEATAARFCYFCPSSKRSAGPRWKRSPVKSSAPS